MFSLLPIQNQTKRENGREDDLEARDSEELERKEDSKGKETLHDISGSTDSERYSQKILFFKLSFSL